MRLRTALSRAASGVILLGVTTAFAPELLAFPYSATVGNHLIYSDRPIPDTLGSVLNRADAKLRRSPIHAEGLGRRIFLTDGGWRWHLLAPGSTRAFAISRPIGEAIVVNVHDTRVDKVWNGRTVGGTRSLSGTLAHEMTHGLIRRRFGRLADWRYPAWLREGYCDHVAGESSLSDREAAALRSAGQSTPSLTYYLGRKRVEALLTASGGSVEAVFRKSAADGW